MNKKTLLHNIAETGYNVGFGGKKHFVAYDLYRIFPRLISTVTIAIGIIQMTSLYKGYFRPSYADLISAILIIIGVIALVIDINSENKGEYEKVGKRLLSLYNELRRMYHEVSNSDDNTNLDTYKQRLEEIEKEVSNISLSRQAIGTHLITHIGFFNVMQSKWVVDELSLTRKDKLPLFHWESIFVLFVLLLILLAIVIRFI